MLGILESVDYIKHINRILELAMQNIYIFGSAYRNIKHTNYWSM